MREHFTCGLIGKVPLSYTVNHWARRRGGIVMAEDILSEADVLLTLAKLEALQVQPPA